MSNTPLSLQECKDALEKAITLTCNDSTINFFLGDTTTAGCITSTLQKYITVHSSNPHTITVRGANCCELFDLLYDPKLYVTNSGIDSDSNLYQTLVSFAYGKSAVDTKLPSFQYVRTDADAVPPSKNKSSDSGFDLTLIKKLKEYNNVTFFDTGIKVSPPLGWYFDLVGRSSISKTGYMLANNIGIIDQSYTGNILVALVKIDQTAPELALPARLVQIIPRKVSHMVPVEVEELEPTGRGDGGFGSSGNP